MNTTELNTTELGAAAETEFDFNSEELIKSALELKEVLEIPTKKSKVEAPSVDAIVGAALAGALLKQKKTGNVLKDNRNLIGGLLGVAVGVGLEIVSPTGSKVSAAVSGVAGLGALAVVSIPAMAAPQCNVIAGTAFGMTSWVSMSAGRLAASYFPGNLDISDEE